MQCYFVFVRVAMNVWAGNKLSWNYMKLFETWNITICELWKYVKLLIYTLFGEAVESGIKLFTC